MAKHLNKPPNKDAGAAESPTRLTGDLLFWVALPCFLLSGAAGLIYEVVWTRLLTQIFGNSTYAVATVLAAFMAGLALGSYIFGVLADRGKNDFLLYGILEIGVGLYGILIPFLLLLAPKLYIPIYPLNASYPLLFQISLFLLAFLFLVLPTVLMGATLPLLSRFFVRTFSHMGRRVGDLYATNTLGAVLGTAGAGYYLIPTLGMQATTYTAAGINLVIGLVIIIIDRLRDKEAPAADPQPTPAETSSPTTATPWTGALLLSAIALSGFSALVYENAWTHTLTLVIGTSVYSFTTMLVTFLIGLSLGGFLYARWLGTKEVHLSTFGVIELGVGLTALATIPLFEKLPFMFLRLLQGLGDSFSLFLLSQLLLSGLVMLVPTILLGMTFPLVARLFTHSLYRVGRSVGTSYAANTLGSIFGAFAGGFLFVPMLGMQHSIVLAMILNLIIGCVLIACDRRLAIVVRGAVATAVIVGLAIIPLRLPQWDPYVLTSGVTIYEHDYARMPTDSLRTELMRQDDLLFYKEGLTATVSVQRDLPASAGQADRRYFRTNGKIDGSSHDDAVSQLLTAYVPLLLAPDAKRAAVIGLGTGMTAKAAAAFPLDRIDVLEIEPAVVEAAQFFNDHNGNLLKDPRVKLVLTDARNHILAAEEPYDLIASEPSNPWIAGIANLYTREFYELVKTRLSDNGIFAQWVHNYSMSPEDFRMVLRTFAKAFPHVSFWELNKNDFLLVGSKSPHDFDYAKAAQVFASNKTLQADLKSFGFDDVYSVLGFYRMGRDDLLAFTEGARLNTDDGAQLEYSAPRNIRRETFGLNRQLMEPFVTEAPWLTTDDASMPDSMRHFHLAQALVISESYRQALANVDQAISLDDTNPAFHVLRAKILLAVRQDIPAAQSALRALEISPDTVEPLLTLSKNFRVPEAQGLLFKKIIELGSANVLPYLGMVEISLLFDSPEEATQWLMEARQVDPENPHTLELAGRVELAQGNSEGARKLLETARERGRDSAKLHGALGDAYRDRELWAPAADSYRRALKLRLLNAHWRRSLALVLTQLGQAEEAAVKFQEALAIAPSDTVSWEALHKLRNTK